MPAMQPRCSHPAPGAGAPTWGRGATITHPGRRHEHQLQITVLGHLQEIEDRDLHLRRGFASLFDYAMRELGYSEAAAWRRIKTMRLCARTPGARARLEDGTLTLSAAAQLQHAFERQERSRTQRRRSPGVTAPAGSATPQAGSPPAEAAAPVEPTAPVPVLDVSARQALVDQAAGKRPRTVASGSASRPS